MSWYDGPDEEWVDEEFDSDDDMMQCPSCGQVVHEDAQKCPHCGDWIIAVRPPRSQAASRSIWWVVIIVLLILSFVMFL